MDNIGSTSKHYKNIAKISSGILILILEAYLMLFFSGIDLFSFSMLKNNNVERYILQCIVQLIIFSAIYLIIYFCVKNIYLFFWKRKNKKIWVKGKWLHIHVKNDIRIGTVEIRQNFGTITAKGHNVSPKEYANSKKSDTTWSYFLGKVVDDETKRDFIGCYSAQDIKNQKTKDGMHVLQILSPDSAKGYPNIMMGGFRDTFDIGQTISISVGDHAGQLFFYKMDEKCQQYLYDGDVLRYDRLADLHNNPDFASNPYVMKLKEYI